MPNIWCVFRCRSELYHFSVSLSLYPVLVLCVAHTTAAASLPTVGSLMPNNTQSHSIHTQIHTSRVRRRRCRRRQEAIYSKVQSPNMSDGTWKPVVMCTRTIFGTANSISVTNNCQNV